MFLTNDELWLKQFELCKDYSRNNDNYAPPALLVVDEVKVGSWYATQLYQFRNGLMSDVRKALFEEYYNSVKTRPSPFIKSDDAWLERFEVYKQYVNESHRFPPNKAEFNGYKVGQWFRNQITAFNGGFLPVDRQKLLDDFHPAWRGTSAEKREAEKQMVLCSDWERLVPAGDASLAEALVGDALGACVLHGIYGCKQYLEFFEQKYGIDCFWHRRAPAVSIGMFGESVFSLESRKAVFEKCFPRMSFECAQLLHDVFGGCPLSAELCSTAFLPKTDRWSIYNAMSRFDDRDDMEQKCKELLSTLHQREKFALEEKYFSHKIQQEIADDFLLSNTRVGQIIRKGERKMRHPSRSRELRPLSVQKGLSLDRGKELPAGLIYATDLDLSGSSCACLPEQFTVCGNLNLLDTPITALTDGLVVHGDLFLSELVQEMPESVRVDGAIHQKVVTRQAYSYGVDDFTVTVVELGFSMDAEEVLYGNGIYTKMDLLNLTERDLMCLQGTYDGFVDEVLEKVRDMGCALCEDNDFVGDLIDRATASCKEMNNGLTKKGKLEIEM